MLGQGKRTLDGLYAQGIYDQKGKCYFFPFTESQQERDFAPLRIRFQDNAQRDIG